MKFLREVFKFIRENIVFLALIALIIGLIKAFLDSSADNERLFNELEGQKEAYVQLSEHAAKLEIKYKSHEELKKELEANWAKEKETLKGRVKLLSNATYLIREKARDEANSDLVYRGSRSKYVYNEIRFENGPPVGYVMIFDNGRVISKIFNHSIDVKTAVARDEGKGTYSIVSKADFVLKSAHLQNDGVNWYKVPYPLKITGGEAVVDPTEPKYALSKGIRWWAPNFNVGANINSDIKPALGVSLMGYGYSARDLDWKFLQIGLDYSKTNDFGVHFIPVLYRPIPKILRNTYFGVGVGTDTRATHYFLALSVGL